MKSSPPTAAERHRFWQRFLTFGRWLLEREELLAAAERWPDRPEEQAQFRRLTSIEPGSNHADPPRQLRNPLIWLASRDELPSLPTWPRRHQGPISRLVSLERLPAKPLDNAPPTRCFLHWLFTLNPHERLENHMSIKEDPPDEP